SRVPGHARPPHRGRRGGSGRRAAGAGAVGTLSNEGVSLFRTTDPAVIKTRIQPAEQWPLSEYQRRGDSIMFRADTRALGIFEGAGVAGTWRLEIPRATNDLDYASIADVRITFYYEARVDAALGQQVAALLRALPGSLSRSRTYPLRWAFSD